MSMLSQDYLKQKLTHSAFIFLWYSGDRQGLLRVGRIRARWLGDQDHLCSWGLDPCYESNIRAIWHVAEIGFPFDHAQNKVLSMELATVHRFPSGPVILALKLTFQFPAPS